MSSKEKKKGLFGKKFGKGGKKGEEGDGEDGAAAAAAPKKTGEAKAAKTKKADKEEGTEGGRTGRGRAREGTPVSPAKGGKKKDGDAAAAAAAAGGGGKDSKPSMFQRVRERSRSRSRSRKDKEGLSDATRKDMLVAVTSCRSDGYYNQKAPGTISKLPRKAPTNLKLFHELAIGVKDAYAAVGETPQKPNPEANGDSAMGREELDARTVLWEFIGNLDFVSTVCVLVLIVSEIDLVLVNQTPKTGTVGF